MSGAFLLFITLFLWQDLWLNLKSLFLLQLHWLALSANECPVCIPLPLGLEMILFPDFMWVVEAWTQVFLHEQTLYPHSHFFFPTPKEFLNQVWNQLRPWDWSWFFSLGKYILFLRRKAGGREILVKIVPNLLEHEIFEGNNNKHLDKMCIHHSQHTALVYLKNRPFWTPDIFRSLRYTHLSFWGVELNTHVSDIFTIIKVHCLFGWLLVLKYLFEALKIILQPPLILTAKGDISPRLCTMQSFIPFDTFF